MIVVTTPTGQIGSKLVARLLAEGEPVRVIVRDAAKLGPDVRERVEVVEGSHGDADVLDRALPGADALFWLVPPDMRASSAEAHYLAFARAGADAVRRHGVGHVVGVTSAGHGWPKPAGLLSAAFAMDAEFERTGVAYRALSMPFYMENLERDLGAIRERGEFSLPYAPDRPLAMIATRDIASTAAGLLTDRSWTGQAHVPVFGPDRLTPNQLADVMSEVMGRSVAYHQTSHEDFVTGLTAAGFSTQAIQDMVEMHDAQNDGLYEADWAAATPTETDFRTWFKEAVAA
ncbi:NAD(P)H-binding protein [Amycolatopsis dongchuanensis]|uniref:NAD(P)H-binding protein n=1 Tax=Amycolatopsis dongchuanensis TaxID=1070866 RepID=A0ABP9Q5S5_9PSEU